ncbi:DUF3520 domain-containing protein [candidate division KSB1 bacterium]|nr:DUF3520 domain-containing protein [candidate division KSB1 bacterium]
MTGAEDFKDDTKDAGEIGAGHTVTALYEIVPPGQRVPGSDVDPSKYQKPDELTEAAATDELLTVRLRYKDPDGQTSKPLEVPVITEEKSFDEATDDFQFAACVAQFGMLLRDSEFKGQASYENVLSLANSAKGSDPEGYRSEFVQLVKKASLLAMN